MTDHHPFDDLASAHLDGATTPEEAARVIGDPELLARVESLRSVRTALSSPSPVHPERREQAIAAALAAYDADAGSVHDPAPMAPVHPLAPVAARRRTAARSWRVVGVAAAVAALVVIVPVLASLSSDSSDDSRNEDLAGAPATEERAEATAGDTPEPTESALAPEAAVSTSTTSATSTTSTGAAAPSLGAFEDTDALVTAARSAAPAPATTFDASVSDPTTCLDDLVEALPPGSTITRTATATVAGSPIAVVVTTTDVWIVGGDCTDVLITPR